MADERQRGTSAWQGQSWDEEGTEDICIRNLRETSAHRSTMSDFTARLWDPSGTPARRCGRHEGRAKPNSLLSVSSRWWTRWRKKSTGSATAADVIAGTQTKIDIRISSISTLLDMATSVEKLISSGCYSINEIREILGEERINEAWVMSIFSRRISGALTTAGGEENA